MVQIYFTVYKLGLLIVCNEQGIGANEYENIIYNSLFSLVDNLLELLKELEIIWIANEIPFLFMQNNVLFTQVLEFLGEHYIPIINWLL